MKGRKRHKKVSIAAPWDPSPDERVKYAAKSLAEVAVAADPGMTTLVSDLSQRARQGASKIVRGKGKGKKD